MVLGWADSACRGIAGVKIGSRLVDQNHRETHQRREKDLEHMEQRRRGHSQTHRLHSHSCLVGMPMVAEHFDHRRTAGQMVDGILGQIPVVAVLGLVGLDDGRHQRRVQRLRHRVRCRLVPVCLELGWQMKPG